MWRWSQKFNSHSLSLIAQFTQKHNSALDFLLRFRIRDHQQFAVVHFVFQHQQSAVRAHHHRFARFTEFLAVMPASLRLHLQFSEDSCASPGGREFNCCAHAPMFCFLRVPRQLPLFTGVSHQKRGLPPALVLFPNSVLQSTEAGRGSSFCYFSSLGRKLFEALIRINL